MQSSTTSRMALCGALAFVLVLATIMIAGDVPGGSDPAKLTAFYADNTGVRAAGIIALSGAALLVVFGAHLRQVIRAASPQAGALGDAALAGAIVFAAALVLDGSLGAAMVEIATDGDSGSLVALSALWNSNLLYALGGALFLAATGAAAVRHGVLPKGLGWAMVVLGLAGLTPAYGIAFFATLVLTAVSSVILARRASRPATAASLAV
jgi:hypothetical protein